MSLLSNRGRFSKNENNTNFIKETDKSSLISSRAYNPTSMFKIESTSDKTEHHDSLNDKNIIVGNKKYKANDFDDKFIDNKFIINHSKYSESKNNKTKKHNKTKLIILMSVVELLTLALIFFVGSFIRVSNMTQKVSFDKSAVKNTNIDANTLAIMKGFKTVAIFGVDSRTGSVDRGNNADVNLIANLNLETGDAQLVSVYRDLYLSVTDQNLYDKLNSAYRKGGPESAVKAINKNLDLNIENFFSFNWKAVANGIELLGGIDLEISKAEYKYMNAFIHETCIATGIDSKNPAAHYIKGIGMQHLDGVQAVAYGRLRLMDSDFQRVERQKKVIALCLQKAKKIDIAKLKNIIDVVLPQIAYEFDMNEMLSILKIINNINIVESCGVPEINNVVTMDMGASGDSVVPLNLEKAVTILHKVLYNKDNYVPSNAVKRYSNRISELRIKYQEENRIKASIKASEEEASRLAELKKKRATKSNTSKKKKATKSNIETDPNKNIEDDDEVPILDDEFDYEEEPEEDEYNDEINNDLDSDENNDNKDNTNDIIVVEDFPNEVKKAPYKNNSDSDVKVNVAPGSEYKQDPGPVSIDSDISPGSNNNESIPNFPISEPGSAKTDINPDRGVVISGPPMG